MSDRDIDALAESLKHARLLNTEREQLRLMVMRLADMLERVGIHGEQLEKPKVQELVDLARCFLR